MIFYFLAYDAVQQRRLSSWFTDVLRLKIFCTGQLSLAADAFGKYYKFLGRAIMTRPIIYKDADAVYTADACKPFKRAMDAGQITAEAWSRGQYPGSPLGKSQIPGIRSIGIWDIDTTQDWFIPPHHNEGFEVCMVLNGTTSKWKVPAMFCAGAA